MIHLTLNTGHCVTQSDQAPPGVVDLMRPLLQGGSLGIVAPELAAYRVEVARGQGGSVFTVWRGREPLATCAVCWQTEVADATWEAVTRLYLSASESAAGAALGTELPDQPASVPWLAVALLPALIAQPRDTAGWLGDFERCMAWRLMANETR